MLTLGSWSAEARMPRCLQREKVEHRNSALVRRLKGDDDASRAGTSVICVSDSDDNQEERCHFGREADPMLGSDRDSTYRSNLLQMLD